VFAKPEVLHVPPQGRAVHTQGGGSASDMPAMLFQHFTQGVSVRVVVLDWLE